MKKTTIIAKHEARLRQTYDLMKIALAKREEIRSTLKNVKNDVSMRKTYELDYNINSHDITSHAFLIAILEVFIADLNLINSLD